MITLNGYQPTIETFPNKETLVKITERMVLPFSTIVWRFEGDHEFMQLGQLISLLGTYSDYENATVVVTNFPYARMDRHEPGKHNPHSLSVASDLLPYIEDVKYLILEPHSDVTYEEMNIFEDRVKIVGLTEIVLEQYLRSIADGQSDPANSIPTFGELLQDVLLVFPDEGAKKRYIKINRPMRFAKYAIGEKTRDFDTHEITGYKFNSEYDVKDFKHVIIVDDIISYGNTFIRLLDELKKQGAQDVSLVTAHAESALLKGDVLNSDFKAVVTSNTMYPFDVEETFFDSLNIVRINYKELAGM